MHNFFSSLPLSSSCVVPEVILHTSSLHYGRCFVTHPYTLNVHLENTSETLPVKYKMIEQVQYNTLFIYVQYMHCTCVMFDVHVLYIYIFLTTCKINTVNLCFLGK